MDDIINDGSTILPYRAERRASEREWVMRRLLFLLLFLAAPVWAGSYTIALSGDASAATVKKKAPPTLAQQAASMSPGEWKKLDTVNTWPSIKVTNAERAAIEAQYGGRPIAGWGNSARVFQAFSGAGWDPAGRRFLFFGGGHASYGGNEVYEFDVNTLTWSRLTLPSALTFEHTSSGKTWWLPRDANSDGKPDQAAVAHTYDSLFYNSNTGTLGVPQHQTLFPHGNVFGARNVNPNHYAFDPDSATWTQYDGHFYWFAICEYIAERKYALCFDSLGTSYHNLYLIHDNGTEEFCGRQRTAPQAGTPGHIHRDEDTGDIYDFRYNNITKITLEADDCAPTYSPKVNTPDAATLGTYWDFGMNGIGTGYDGKLYLWSGYDQKIVVYDTVAETFELREFRSQAATGPYAAKSAGGGKVLSKWRCFETERVCLGIADPATKDNPRGGLWLWKIGPDAPPQQANRGTITLGPVDD